MAEKEKRAAMGADQYYKQIKQMIRICPLYRGLDSDHLFGALAGEP